MYIRSCYCISDCWMIFASWTFDILSRFRFSAIEYPTRFHEIFQQQHYFSKIMQTATKPCLHPQTVKESFLAYTIDAQGRATERFLSTRSIVHARSVVKNVRSILPSSRARKTRSPAPPATRDPPKRAGSFAESKSRIYIHTGRD